jgi:hypothetical protein
VEGEYFEKEAGRAYISKRGSGPKFGPTSNMQLDLFHGYESKGLYSRYLKKNGKMSECGAVDKSAAARCWI